MAWAAIFLLSIVAAALAIHWFINASPARLARGIRLGAVWLAVSIVLLLAVTGRLPWLTGLVAPLVAIILALLARRRARPAQDWGADSGRQSTVSTRYLEMTLDHDSGELDGRVVSGAFEGRVLSAMTLEELRTLLAEVSADPDSFNVLASFLDRRHGGAWREAGDAGNGHGAADGGAPLTQDEAYRVLGLSTGATEEEIRAAHRRLMKLAHPDHGGSDYLASKINQAKDLLLGG